MQGRFNVEFPNPYKRAKGKTIARTASSPLDIFKVMRAMRLKDWNPWVYAFPSAKLSESRNMAQRR